MASAIWLAIPSTSRLTFKPTSAAVVPAVAVCEIFGAGFSSAEAKDKGQLSKRHQAQVSLGYEYVSSCFLLCFHLVTLNAYPAQCIDNLNIVKIGKK